MNAFTLISRHVEPHMREFSLAAASLGDSLGIAFADVAGVLLQVSTLSIPCMRPQPGLPIMHGQANILVN